ncbi:MAG TPA: hypothetical protein PLZ45_06810 [Ferruginibacter sp.]|nr:hypothetical protein [Ferruginibacter sp.]
MNLVIPLRNDNRYEQLRFALRSITKQHKIDRCIIVGGRPGWYKGDHLPHKDYSHILKEHNIRDKVIAGASTITGEFMFANDDHILLSPLTKTYHKGFLQPELANRFGNGSYTRCLRNTYERYGNVANVDTHCPMMLDAELVKRTDFDWPDFGIGFKTCYAQENNIGSDYYPDCKVSVLKEVRNRLWFSMTDQFNVKELFGIFPEKSIFEM